MQPGVVTFFHTVDCSSFYPLMPLASMGCPPSKLELELHLVLFSP